MPTNWEMSTAAGGASDESSRIQRGRRAVPAALSAQRPASLNLGSRFWLSVTEELLRPVIADMFARPK